MDLIGIYCKPFAKAVYMTFLVSEVHPFLDGHGRIARVMMNAELSAKGLSKIIRSLSQLFITRTTWVIESAFGKFSTHSNPSFFNSTYQYIPVTG